MKNSHAYVVGQITGKNEADADGWHNSAAYQALIPLRQEAADMVLTAYEN